MPDLDLAWRAVLAAPRDDAPRARFADLVASAEPDTASFVRTQLDLARRRRQKPRRDRQVERGAVAAPPPRHEARFAAARALLDGTVPGWTQRLGYGRGFLERVTVDGAWFASRGSELLARAPIVDVTVHACPADPTELFDSPAWAHVRSLRFVGASLHLSQVECLCQSPYLGRLAVLDLSQMGLPLSALHAVIRAPLLARLRYLRADGNEFPDPNPTIDEQDGQSFGERASAFAEALRQQFGDRPWLAGIPQEAEPHPEALG